MAAATLGFGGGLLSKIFAQGKSGSDLESDVGNFTEDLKKAGADISGKTARDASKKASDLAAQNQADMEKRIYDKGQLDKASADQQAKRQAQKAMQMKQGGRASTILTGGIDQSQPQVDAGKKVLLGS